MKPIPILICKSNTEFNGFIMTPAVLKECVNSEVDVIHEDNIVGKASNFNYQQGQLYCKLYIKPDALHAQIVNGYKSPTFNCSVGHIHQDIQKITPLSITIA